MFSDPLNEAQVYAMRGDHEAAIKVLLEYINNDFFHPESLFILGASFQAKGFNGMSAVLTSAAIDARAAKGQKFPEAVTNLGNCYKMEHDHLTAEKIFLDALRLETLAKDRANIMNNIASLHINNADPEIAIEWCDRALLEHPKNHPAAANRGLACLELARWREGWKGYAHTYFTGDRVRKEYAGVPVWKGRPDQTVIVWGDQGIGDEIFFANSLNDMVAYSKRVVLDCHPRLEHLFRRSFPNVEVHGTRKDLSKVDWFEESGADGAIALSELPEFFRNEDADWKPEAYLKADPIFPLDKLVPRIGISWTGGTKPTRQELRSFPIETLEPIIRVRPEAEWFSLQYTPNAAREVCEFQEKTGIRVAHFPGYVECFDYDKTASFVNSLDLVITVCTSIHHLSSALGRPTWTLVPSKPSWRYQIKGETLPWYGSARCFRQEGNDWSSAFEQVVEALKAFRC